MTQRTHSFLQFRLLMVLIGVCIESEVLVASNTLVIRLTSGNVTRSRRSKRSTAPCAAAATGSPGRITAGSTWTAAEHGDRRRGPVSGSRVRAASAVAAVGEEAASAAPVERVRKAAQQVPEQVAGARLRGDVQVHLVQVHDEPEQVQVERPEP